MAYFEPYIDSTGFHYSTYDDVLEYYIEQLKLIYGSDIYLEADSQDYQMVSIRAKMAYDLMNGLAMVLSNQSPSTSIGTALDARVEWNGIKRKIASYSTCDLKLNANVGTVIHKGIVKDSSGVLWNLPEEVIITQNPQTVTATCQDIGAIEAPINTITEIVTPIKGWISVTNEQTASVGAKVETDEELKERRKLSVANPSINLVDSVQAGIMSIEGVSKCKVYENDTNITDDNGIPPHSISCVVDGGDTKEIAQCIYLRKGGGTGTYANSERTGFVEETVTTSTGLPILIQFCRPIQVPVYIQVTLIKTGMWNDDRIQAVNNYVQEYFNNIGMGDDIYASSIIAVISQAITDLYNPEFRISSDIYMGTDPEDLNPILSQGIAYNEIATLGNLQLMGV